MPTGSPRRHPSGSAITPQQLLLLRAGLLDRAPALAAFDGWLRTTDLDRPIDPGSSRLLPMVHANLVRFSPDDRDVQRLKPAYLRAWAAAHGHVTAAQSLLGSITAHAIPVLVLKGLPLALDYYPQPGLRPMADIDAMVPIDRVRDVVDLLASQGWHVVEDAWRRDMAHALRVRTAITLRDAGGREFDLHWRLSPEAVARSFTDAFWARAQSFTLNGIAVLQPSPSDFLLHICIHGTRSNPMPPVRWAADVMMILRRAETTLDWDLVVTTARQLHVSHRVGRALGWLADTLDASIPPHVLAALTSSGPRVLERLDGDGAPTRTAMVARMVAGGRAREVPLMLRDWLRHRLPGKGDGSLR